MFLPNNISPGDRLVVVCGVILYWNRNLAIRSLGVSIDDLRNPCLKRSVQHWLHSPVESHLCGEL